MKVDITKNDISKTTNMPMFDKTMANFGELAKDYLRRKVSTNLDVFVNKTVPIISKDYNNDDLINTIAVIFSIENWNAKAFIVIENDLVYGLLELLLGGSSIPSLKVVDRGFTNIEKSLIENVATIIMTSFQQAFSDLDHLIFSVNRVENNPLYALPKSESDILFLTRMNIKSQEREGNIDFVILEQALRPIRSSLAKPFNNKSLAKKESWLQHFSEVAANSSITLTAEINNTDMTLTDIKNAKIGDMLVTNKLAEDEIEIKINGSMIAKGKLGKVGDKLAAQLTSFVHQQ